MRAAIFCIHDNITTSSTEQYSFMKIIVTVLKIEHCSLNNQGEITQKVCKQELQFQYVTHCHDLFCITVKCHDNIPKGIKLQNGLGIASETIKGK